MTKVIVGIIGFGLSGRHFFAPFLSYNPNFSLEAFVTTQASEVKNIYPQALVYSDVDDLLANENIELIVVASPNSTHFNYAKKALLAGKNVIVEKPFTITSAEAHELILLSKKQNKILAPFQNRRWDGDFLTVKKLIEEDALGEILEFESHFDRFRPDSERVAWKNEFQQGVGTLFDIGPHLIDQALCLFGKPDYVSGDIRKLRLKGENPDSFEIQLHYPQTKVILKAGVMVREVGPRFIVHGRKGSFVKYGLDVQEKHLKDGLLPGNSYLGKDRAANFGVLNTGKVGEEVRTRIPTVDGNYMAYFENVYRAIQGKENLIVKPEQGKLIIEVIEKAVQSNEEKRLLPF
jgi:predicted dehydrogenase